MVWLTITIPLFSATVSAASLSQIGAAGKDGIPGIVRLQDQVSITANAAIDGDAQITSDQVKLSLFSTELAMECTISGECAATFPQDGERIFSASNKYSIKLYNDHGALVKTADDYFYNDILAPRITSFSILEPLSADGQVTLDIELEERSGAGGYPCAGMAEIQVYENTISGEPLETIPINEPSQCSFALEHEFAYPGTESGEKTLCIRAIDRFLAGSSERRCATFTLDLEGVEINSASARLRDNLGIPILAYKNAALGATFTINITGSDLNTNAVTADFSSINGDTAPRQASACTLIRGATYSCLWETELSLSEDDAGAKSITITAEDEAGNSISVDATFILSYDETSPTVSDISTAFESGGKLFASRAGSSITAGITESGSGLAPSQVFLHREGQSSVAADSCTQAGCTFTVDRFDVPANRITERKVWIGTDSSDRAGNPFAFGESDRFEVAITIDDTLPRVNSFSYSPGEFLKVGDSATITFNVTDENGVASAVADLSAIKEGATEESAACSNRGDDSLCIWQSVRIEKTGPAQRELFFTFVDHAGRESAAVRLTIEVLAVAQGAGDFYTLQISPWNIFGIDRETLRSLTTQTYSQDIPFILDYREGSCTAAGPDDLVVYNARLDGAGCLDYNIYLGKSGYDYSGFIEFLVGKEHADFEEIEIADCFLKFDTICSQQTYTVPETEPITLTIPITSSVTPAQSLEDEIEELKKDASSLEIIGKLRKILQMLENICQIKQLFGKVMSALSFVGFGFAKACENPSPLMSIFCPAEKVTAAQFTAASSFFEKFALVLNLFCNYVTCGSQPSPPGAPVDFLSYTQGHLCEKLNEMIWSIGASRAGQGADRNTGMDWAIGFMGSNRPSVMEMAKKSYLFSAACFCIPGIVYNMEKKRQLDCWKGVCLRDMVAAGVPVEQCRTQDAYNRCVYWNGQWTAVLEYLLSPIQGILQIAEHPIASAWVVTRLSLKTECDAPTLGSLKWSGMCMVYSSMLIIENIADVAALIINKGNLQFGDPFVDFCEILDKEEGT